MTVTPVTGMLTVVDPSFQLQQPRRFAGLDGLRAVAILLVIFSHMPRVSAGWLRNVQDNGSSGVSLFFVISGFLITTLFLHEQPTAKARRALARFVCRRAIRLWPAYYVVLGFVLLAATCTTIFSAQSASVLRGQAVVYACYLTNWLPDKDGPFFFSWSLAAEEQFYVVFGVVAYVFGARGLRFATLARWWERPIRARLRPHLDQWAHRSAPVAARRPVASELVTIRSV